MTDDVAAPTRRSRWRRFWLVILVLTLVFLLARAGLDLWAGRRVDAEVARLEQRYGTLAEGSLRLDRVPSADNRARAVRAAAALTVLDSGSRAASRRSRALPGVSDLVPGASRRSGHSSKPIERPSGWQKTAGPGASPTGTSNPSGFNTPPWMELRTLSNAICLDRRSIDLEDGRPDDAAKAITSGLAVSSSLRQERNLIAQLIRICHRHRAGQEPSAAARPDGAFEGRARGAWRGGWPRTGSRIRSGEGLLERVEARPCSHD